MTETLNLVKQLRDDRGADPAVTGALMERAANEIERLQHAAEQELAAHRITTTELRECHEDIRRLRAELREQEGYPGIAHDFEQCRQERDRLRAALDEADDLLCCAEAAENLEGATAEDWQEQCDGWLANIEKMYGTRPNLDAAVAAVEAALGSPKETARKP